VLRNIGSNWALIVATMAATYVTTPFIIHRLGQDGYGTWTLIGSITGYMSLLALGVPMACVRYLAQHVAEGDTRRINQTIGTCAGLYLMVGAAAILAGSALGLLFLVYEIPQTFRLEAYFAFSLMVLYVALSFLGLLPEGILFAHHGFVLRNLVRVCGVGLRLVLTVGLLTYRPSLVLLALVQLAGVTFDFSVSLFFIRRSYPNVRISLADFDWITLRRIFSFSVYVLLLHAGARLTFETDALVVGAFIGVGAIPYYVVANSLVIYLMEFVVAIAAVVSPMATKLQTDGKHDELREIFLKWSKVSLSLTTAVGLFLLVLGPRFLAWWIDPSYEEPAGGVLQILLVSCFAFLPVRGVAQPLLIGLGKPKAPTVGFLVTGVLNLVLSIALVRPFGLAGVALGTAIPNVLFSGMLVVVACRELRIPLVDYVAYVVPRALVGGLPVLALLLWFRLGVEVETFAGLAIAGAAMGLLFALIWVLFVYRNDPYVDVKAPFVRIRSWSRA
jgi:O-antigen/teichoic acid export membrane protein